MFKCTKSCFNKTNFKNNAISFIKLYPLVWLTLKTIYNNTFVQVLLFLMIGITLLWYGQKINDQTFTTVAITIISASLFKFFISANAFVTVISKVVRESFIDMEFLKHFKDAKLISTTKTLIKELNTRKFTQIEDNLSKHIFSILDADSGYNSKLDITIEDVIVENIRHTTSTYKCTRVVALKDDISSSFTFNNSENEYKLQKVLLNNIDITAQISKNLIVSNNKKDIAYKIPMEAGENSIEIVESYYDSDQDHTIFFNQISSNVKVTYKHDAGIIYPKIITRYGEEKESRAESGELYIDYGDKIFTKNEFIFIKFALKEVQNVPRN